MRQWRGGVPGPPRGGTRVRYPPGGYPGQVPPRGGTQSGTPLGGTRVRYPPWGGVPRSGTPLPGGTQVRYPPGGYLGQVPPSWGGPGSGTPPGGPRSGNPPRGGTRVRYPPGGGTRVGQQKEYSLHGGRYASCVHAGGLSGINPIY